MALEFGITLVFVPRTDRRVQLTSLNFAGPVSFCLDAVPDRQTGAGPEEDNWGNFARGAATALQSSGHRLASGVSGVVMAPPQLDSSGVSSSAALGCACLLALEEVNQLRLTTADNIELDRVIENGYLCLKNGIMDQSVCLAAGARCLTLVDCVSRAISHAPLPPALPADGSPFAILLAFSGVKAALAASSGFNDRVAECHAAAERLLTAVGRPRQPSLLGNLSQAEYAAHKHVLGDTPEARRAEHFFSEAARVHQGAQLWRAGDLPALGALINASGASSAINYEVGSPELRFLQAALQACRGVFGARFSGAGTRGACVALVQPEQAASIAARVLAAYASAYPHLAAASQVISSDSGPGARCVDV